MKSDTSMACVSVGYMDLLLSAEDGMRLVKLLQAAVPCDRKYEDDGYVYKVRGQEMAVELRLLKPDRVHMPDGTRAEPAPARPSTKRIGLSQPLLERVR